MNELQGKVKTIQSEVDEIQESLQEAVSKLEETDKRATNVSYLEKFYLRQYTYQVEIGLQLVHGKGPHI